MGLVRLETGIVSVFIAVVRVAVVIRAVRCGVDVGGAWVPAGVDVGTILAPRKSTGFNIISRWGWCGAIFITGRAGMDIHGGLSGVSEVVGAVPHGGRGTGGLARKVWGGLGVPRGLWDGSPDLGDVDQEVVAVALEGGVGKGMGDGFAVD